VHRIFDYCDMLSLGLKQFTEQWHRINSTGLNNTAANYFVELLQVHEESLLLRAVLLECFHQSEVSDVLRLNGPQFAVSSILMATDLLNGPLKDGEHDYKYPQKVLHRIVCFSVFLLACTVEQTSAEALGPALEGPNFSESVRRVWRSFHRSPRVLNSLCYILESQGVKLTTWQCAGADMEWKDLPDNMQLALQKAVAEGARKVYLSSGYGSDLVSYEADLEENTLLNVLSSSDTEDVGLDTKRLRKIEVDVSEL